ncbi:MAG: HAMP domain-containing protein [Candidatus Wallbacteria bacterium]|nr:HAMP domain-containing protein [Candidatus Wallbacteria bacterium]
MRQRLGTLVRSATFRLLLRLLPIIAAVSIAYAFVSFHSTRDRITELTENDALRTSELIKSATHYGMLLHRKDEVHHTLRQLVKSPGVAGIRIYDKQGTIIFSANSEEIGRRVSPSAEACVDCHAKGLDRPAREPSHRFRQFRARDGSRVLGLINPIQNEPSCSTAACHAHRPEQTVLGVLDVQMSMDFMERAIGTTRIQLAWATVAMLAIVSLATAIFIHRVVRRPVQRICEGTERVAAGDFTASIEVETADEIGRLAEAFNRMTRDLGRAREEVQRWASELERRVAEKTEELSRVERHVAHVDKMSSLGKLAASVAHELNNPLAGILNYAKLIDRQLRLETLPEASREELAHFTELVQQESLRCGGIVRNLLAFARQSQVVRAQARLNAVVQASLMLIRHHLALNDVKLETELIEGDDTLTCDASQLEQALVALMINAVEAMKTTPTRVLGVTLGASGDKLDLRISDTGVGIPPEAMSHIFEPFFSTKEAEGGVGLGLAVVYGIMQSHGYTIEVESEPGKGTTFHLQLTRQPAGQG